MILSRVPIFVSLITILVFCGCEASNTTKNFALRRITYVLDSEPGNIDPHLTSEDDTATMNRQIYDTLVYQNPFTQEIVPGLAVEWTISTDGLVYTFSLRKGVLFHDKTIFNADAVAQNFDRIININQPTAKSRLLIGAFYGGHSIIDEYTIQIRLTQAYAPFLDVLSQPYLSMASPIAFQQYSQERYQFHQVGTGPFILEDYIPGKNIIIRRNSMYTWGPSFYEPFSEGSIEEIEFRFVQSNSQRFEIINNREADVVTNLLPTDARTLTANSHVQIIPVAITGQPLQFLFNTNRFPTDNLSFRQALIYSANRNIIVDAVFQRFSLVAWAPLTANNHYYNRNLIGTYAPDTGRAQQLLANAGYSDTNKDKYLDFGGVETPITIVVPSRDLYPEIVRNLVEQWQLIGVKTNIVSVPTITALKARVETNEYNLVAFSMRASDPIILNDFFVDSSPYNWAKVSDASLAGLLGQGMAQSDIMARQTIYSQVQQQIMDQALILPLVDPVRLDAVSSNIANLQFDTFGIPILNNVLYLTRDN